VQDRKPPSNWQCNCTEGQEDVEFSEALGEWYCVNCVNPAHWDYGVLATPEGDRLLDSLQKDLYGPLTIDDLEPQGMAFREGQRNLFWQIKRLAEFNREQGK